MQKNKRAFNYDHNKHELMWIYYAVKLFAYSRYLYEMHRNKTKQFCCVFFIIIFCSERIDFIVARHIFCKALLLHIRFIQCSFFFR